MRTGRYRERIESELSFLDTVAKDLGRDLSIKWEDEVRKGVLSDAYCLKELSKRYDPGSGFCLICDYDKSMELLDLAIESWKVEPKDVEISDLLEMKSYYYQLRGDFDDYKRYKMREILSYAEPMDWDKELTEKELMEKIEERKSINALYQLTDYYAWHHRIREFRQSSDLLIEWMYDKLDYSSDEERTIQSNEYLKTIFELLQKDVSEHFRKVSVGILDSIIAYYGRMEDPDGEIAYSIWKVSSFGSQISDEFLKLSAEKGYLDSLTIVLDCYRYDSIDDWMEQLRHYSERIDNPKKIVNAIQSSYCFYDASVPSMVISEMESRGLSECTYQSKIRDMFQSERYGEIIQTVSDTGVLDRFSARHLLTIFHQGLGTKKNEGLSSLLSRFLDTYNAEITKELKEEIKAGICNLHR